MVNIGLSERGEMIAGAVDQQLNLVSRTARCQAILRAGAWAVRAAGFELPPRINIPEMVKFMPYGHGKSLEEIL
jgi:hypothetical protein